MPVDYVDRIRELDWPGLRRLWNEIEEGTAAGWPPGRALEHLVLRAFELGGATVRWPYPVRVDGAIVEQIDGAVYLGSLSCLVECKDTAAPTRVDAIAKLRNQLLRRHASVIGLMFSRKGFTASALTLAQYLAPQVILLWTGGDIAYLLEHEDFCSALRRKYQHSIEMGIPEYDLGLEEVT